jgi:hypothetical protein
MSGHLTTMVMLEVLHQNDSLIDERENCQTASLRSTHPKTFTILQPVQYKTSREQTMNCCVHSTWDMNICSTSYTAIHYKFRHGCKERLGLGMLEGQAGARKFRKHHSELLACLESRTCFYLHSAVMIFSFRAPGNE